MGVGAGTPERALSPSSASDHLGNSRFKPDLQCPASPSGAGFPEPRGQEKAARTEGSGELPAARDPVRQTSLSTEWGQPSLVPQHHSFEGASQGGAVLPLIGEMRPPVGCLSPCCMWGCRGWPGGLGRLSPATAGLSVKGLPVTKNFL